MQRVTQGALCIVLLIGSTGYGQSIADAARDNKKQQPKKGAATAKVFSNDDISSTPDTIAHLVPGSDFAGQGSLVAPGRWKHNYRTIRLDASQFANGGTLHITITLGNGASDASFDLYPMGPLPTDGFPKSLAHAYDVPRGSTAKIDYRFDHGQVYLLGAEGNWNSKAGTTNTYSFVVDVKMQ
ncbi:MAG TPA: hypothetical protein VK699_18530 [Terriglobales bacterium]|jgi:hypothetical protein|nr:hypothetical protein [Terriglobales bacterium]